MDGHAGAAAAEALRRWEVDTVFTLSGGHLFPVYDGLVDRGVRLVDVRHEQTAVFAAEAWAKASRRCGVALLTAGPGVTNGVSGIAGAHLAGSPLAVLGGRAPHGRWGTGSLQELDHVPLVRSITRRAATAKDAGGVAAEIDATMLAAVTPHRGPAFCDLPLDVLASASDLPVGAPPRPPDRPAPDPDDIVRVAALLRDAEHPVVVAGSDAYWECAEEALRRLVEELHLPLFANGLGRGLVAADHPLALSRCRGVALDGADVVVVVGAPLDFRLRFGDLGAARLVHLCDTPSQVATHVPLAASAAGDLRMVLDGILAAAVASGRPRDHRPWVERLRAEETARRAREEVECASEATPIAPARVIGEVRRRLERDAVVIGDGGDFVSYAGRLVDSHRPGCFIDPGPYGCLGTGMGYALGARMARPDARIVLLLGDGAAGFSLMDLDTLVRHDAPVVAVIGNNGIWGLEKHPMRAFFGYDVAADLRPGTRYDEVARALGGHGELVTEPAEIGPALDRAFAAGVPAVVNVITDPADAYPRSSNLA